MYERGYRPSWIEKVLLDEIRRNARLEGRKITEELNRTVRVGLEIKKQKEQDTKKC